MNPQNVWNTIAKDYKVNPIPIYELPSVGSRRLSGFARMAKMFGEVPRYPWLAEALRNRSKLYRDEMKRLRKYHKQKGYI